LTARVIFLQIMRFLSEDIALVCDLEFDNKNSVSDSTSLDK
jgi:hypothetical protein